MFLLDTVQLEALLISISKLKDKIAQLFKNDTWKVCISMRHSSFLVDSTLFSFFQFRPYYSHPYFVINSLKKTFCERAPCRNKFAYA
jgi:hypothetical protein